MSIGNFPMIPNFALRTPQNQLGKMHMGKSLKMYTNNLFFGNLFMFRIQSVQNPIALLRL